MIHNLHYWKENSFYVSPLSFSYLSSTKIRVDVHLIGHCDWHVHLIGASDWTIASDWLPALIFRCDCPNFHFQVGKLTNEPVIFAQTVVLFCWRNNWVLAPFSIRTKVWHLTSASTKHFGRWLFKTSFADQAIVTLPICKRRMFKLLVISLKSFATG